VADDQEEESENLIMTDDGSGHSVDIPSFIIRKREADLIKKALKSQDEGVYIKAAFEMTHPDNRVEYDLWYSSVLDLEYDKLADIGLF
jgi:hypothetical protein